MIVMTMIFKSGNNEGSLLKMLIPVNYNKSNICIAVPRATNNSNIQRNIFKKYKKCEVTQEGKKREKKSRENK